QTRTCFSHSRRPNAALSTAPSGSCRRTWMRLHTGVHQADQMPFGIGELADLDVGSGHRIGTIDACAAEALGPRERNFDIGHLDVEGHVTCVLGGRRGCDAAADASNAL